MANMSNSALLLLGMLLLLNISSLASAARDVQKLSASNVVDTTNKSPTTTAGEGLGESKNFLGYGGVGGTAGIGAATGIVGPFGGVGTYGGIGGGAGLGTVGGVVPIGGAIGGIGGGAGGILP